MARTFPVTMPAMVRWLLLTLLTASPGCARWRMPETPTKAGLSAAATIDPPAQFTYEEQTSLHALMARGEKLRELAKPAVLPPKRTVLCLSGGGSYGAYSAGVLCGWSQTGGRPAFDVVTGISTGALIAPLAFLGPQYDGLLKSFYTEIETRDIYTKRVVRGVLGQSLADNKPLARKLDETITLELMTGIACEHRKGRRLYVGTTSLEAKRFVIWNLGEIASRGTETDRQLMIKILLGSSAIPGFFPPSAIPVNIDGKEYMEYHVDGGVSQSLFFVPPANDGSLYGTDVYCVVAGKLYCDAEDFRIRSYNVASKSVVTILYAQTRGDLTRLWSASQLSGMNYFCTTIPQDFPAPADATDFSAKALTPMFDEGVRQIQQGTAWRSTPPGVEPNEAHLIRNGTNLTVLPRR